MAGRRTNLALLGLTALAFVSGFVAFGLGTPIGALVVVLHGVLGLSILLLARSKTLIASRGLAKDKAGKGLSISLSILAVVTVLSGVLQVSGRVDRLGSLSMMQIHVGAGVLVLVLVLVHLVQRPVRPRATDFSRRNLVRAGGVLGAAGIVYVITEGIWRLSGAPAAERRFTGSHKIDDIAVVPATQWLNDSVPNIDPGSVVTISGRSLTTREIASFDDRVTATLDCTGGWYTTQEWSGVTLDRFVDGGESIVVTSVTGYWRRFPAEQASELLLATHVAGEPLRRGHGAPVRLVAPDRRGFWWVKWVESVEVDDRPSWWQPPLPMA